MAGYAYRVNLFSILSVVILVIGVMPVLFLACVADAVSPVTRPGGADVR